MQCTSENIVTVSPHLAHARAFNINADADADHLDCEIHEHKLSEGRSKLLHFNLGHLACGLLNQL